MAKRRRGRKSRIKQRERRQQMIIVGTLVGIVVVVIAIILWGIINAPPDVSDERLAQEAVRGNANATVQIVEYGAYGCHACQSLAESQTIENIVNSNSNVQFIFRNVPIISENDRAGAEVAQCALDQGQDQFWAIHDAIFELETDEYIDASEDDLIELAGEAGVNTTALETCLDERTHERTVDHWEGQGRRAQITSTPTLFVNGQRVDTASLEAAVQAALSAGS